MALLERLHPRFRVDARQRASTDEDVQNLLRYAGVEVPAELMELVAEASDIEILVDESGYVRFYGAETIVEVTEAYRFREYIPRALAIGDDEGGRAILLMKGTEGEGLYLVSYGNIGIEDATFVAPSLADFLLKGVGPPIGT